MSHQGYRREINLLLEAGRDAGNLLLGAFGQAIQVSEKGAQDLVTEADYAAERLILDRISREFPRDAITAEEGGLSGESDRRWYIDPLDGTVNFAHGVPSFAVCIAFTVGAIVQASVVYSPYTRECFTAIAGEGARLNGLPISCSAIESPGLAHVFVNPHGLRGGHAESLLEIYRRIGKTVQGILNAGSMSLSLCAVACGRLDAAIGLDVDDYSTPASSMVMQEAGVQVTDLQGAPYQPGIRSILAANRTLHPAFAELLA